MKVLSENDRVKIRRFKRKLEQWGMPADEVELCAAQARERIAAKRVGRLDIDAPICIRASYVRLLRRQPSVYERGAAVLRLGDDYETPDDAGFKPTPVDTVLTGVARATGATARSVKRRKALTKYEHDALNATSEEET